MNKYQEALDFLRNKAKTSSKSDYEILLFHLDVIEELVDKATPNKPIYNEEIDEYRCKQCGHLVIEGWRAKNYCSNCGQALDWSDEK